MKHLFSETFLQSDIQQQTFSDIGIETFRFWITFQNRLIHEYFSIDFENQSLRIIINSNFKQSFWMVARWHKKTWSFEALSNRFGCIDVLVYISSRFVIRDWKMCIFVRPKCRLLCLVEGSIKLDDLFLSRILNAHSL